MVLTKKMVQPVYKYLKLAEICNILPISLDTQSGKFSRERTLFRRIIYYVLFFLSCCKNVYLIYSFTRTVTNPAVSIAVIILVALWFSLCSGSTFWSYELFQKNESETILLFNIIQFASSESAPYRSPTSFREVVAWIKKLSIQELLILVSPYALSLYAPLYVGLMTIRPRWHVFVTAVIPESYVSSPWIFGLLVGVEGMTAFFMECNLIFLIFLELALQTCYLPVWDDLADKMR